MAMTVSATVQLNDMMSGALQHITSALNIMIDNMGRTDSAIDAGFDSSAINEARQHINTANAELAETEERLNDIRNKANGAASATKNIESATRSVANASDNWLNKMAQIGAGYLSIRAVMEGVKAAIGLSDQVSQTTARLDLIVDDGGSVDELEARIRASAERSRASYQTTADSISKLGMLASDSFGSNMELIAFAELLNKSFVVAGTTATEMDAAMLQLTQAMAAGKLQGDEFRSIMENAPMVADAISEYMGVSKGELKELSSDGAITADIIKNSLFDAADDINQKFEQMPVTWEQLWVGFVDDVRQAFDPLSDSLSELAASENIQEMFEGISNAVAVVAAGLAWVTDKLDGFVGAVQENWEVIRPILIGLAAIWAVVQIATLLATIQQWAYNVAMYACPIVWIIAATIAWIAIIFAAAASLAKLTGLANSAFGIICGIVATAGAFIWNLVVGVVNAIIQFFWGYFVEPFIGIIEWIINVCEGGFDSFGSAVANLIGQIINWFLNLGQVVTTIIDAIFSFDWTSGLQSMQNEVLAWGKNEGSFSIDEEWHTAPKIERIEYGGAWKAGAEFGDGISEKILGAFDFNTNNENDPSKYFDEMENFLNGYMDMYSGLDGLADGTDETAKNTKEIAKNTQKTSELMDLVKDNWEKKLIKAYTSKATTITYDLSGMQNTYNNAGQNFDPVKEVERYLRKKAAISTEGI